MANRADTSIAHVLRRALAEKIFGKGVPVALGRVDALIAPLSVDTYLLEYSWHGAYDVRVYRFSDGSTLEAHCAGGECNFLHDYDPVGLARLMDEVGCTDVIEAIERRDQKARPKGASVTQHVTKQLAEEDDG